MFSILPTIVQIAEVHGIYVDHIFTFHKKVCFFDFGIPTEPVNGLKRVKLWNNMARLAGNSIYGGYIDNCSVITSPLQDPYPGFPGRIAFPKLFDIPQNSSLTEVTSDIRNLCFCDTESRSPSCEFREKQAVIFPGQEITIPAVAVGQFNGTVPSVVLSEIIHQANSVANIGDQQDVQQLSTVCGDLHYRIKAAERSNIQINLQTSYERQQRPTQSLSNALRLYVNVTSCPTGFVQRNEDTEQGCNCINFLKERGVICHISDLTFELTPPLWIGYDSTSQLILSTIPALLIIAIQVHEFL